MLSINKIHNMDCLAGLKQLPDGCMDCVITSPPYWALRDYGSSVQSVWGGNDHCKHVWVQLNGDKNLNLRTGKNSQCSRPWREQASSVIHHGNHCVKCGAWKGQLGLEPDIDLFIQNLCSVFDEVKRVLKDTGTCWINLGDTYYTKSGSSFENDRVSGISVNDKGINRANKLRGNGRLPGKNLCLIPFRFAIEMQNRGWIIRNVIIWHKPNCMPSSVKDRFTVDFEYVFFFVKSPKYHFETQYDPYKEPLNRWGGQQLKATGNSKWARGTGQRSYRPREMRPIAFGRNKRTVWTIPTQSFRGAHFATYPEALIAIPVKAGCPEHVCSKCGKARRKIIKTKYIPRRKPGKSHKQPKAFPSDRFAAARPQGMKYGEADAIRTEAGYTDCGCNARFSPGIVLDPFMGSGTTAVVAKKFNRDFIGFEMNPEYCKIAASRMGVIHQN